MTFNQLRASIASDPRHYQIGMLASLLAYGVFGLGPTERGKRTAPRGLARVLTDTEIVTSGKFPGTRYQHLVAAVEREIDEADLIRLLEIGAPGDEYAPEIGAILPRLATVEHLDDVTDVLHEEFLRWFGHGVAGPRDAYEAPARRIWDAVLEYRQSETLG
jgi:hypothetical protein